MECKEPSPIDDQVEERVPSQRPVVIEKDEPKSPVKAVKSPSPCAETDFAANNLLLKIDTSIGDNPTQETVASVKKMCCLSIEVVSDQLEKRESEIRQERLEIQSALSEIIAERKNLSDGLRLLVLKSQELEQDLTIKNDSISADVQLVDTLSADVNNAREERNRFLTDKKKTRHSLLQTEIKLRELQVQLIKQQIEAGDTKLDESDPRFIEITNNQKLVDELTELVANKSAAHKETEAAHQKAEQLFRQKNEEHEELVKRSEKERKNCQELREKLSQVTSEIDTIKLKLNVLVGERKNKCLRAIEIAEESLKIETCKKLKAYEQERKKLQVGEEDTTFEEEFMRKLGFQVSAEIPEQEDAFPTISTPPESEQASTNHLANSSQPPVETSAQVSSNLEPPKNIESQPDGLTVDTETSLPLRTTVVPMDAPSDSAMETETSSPQTQPICLRVSPTMMSSTISMAPSPGLPVATSATYGSPTVHHGSPAVVQPVPSNNILGIRMVDSLTNPESVQASTSQNVIPASFAQTLHPISLNSLSDALPFYAPFISQNSQTVNSNDESLLCQEIVTGCRHFTTWKHSSSKDFPNLSRESALLRQIAKYMKEFLFPFYQLMLAKNAVAVPLLLDSIVQQAQNANWYGATALDPIYMRQTLESNLRYAIEIGIKFKEKAAVPPSRVEFSPSSGNSSMPTFTIHPPNPEAFRSPTLANHQLHAAARNSAERLMERPQTNTVTQSESSPIGALNSMLTNQVRHQQSSTSGGGSAQHSPNTLVTEGHPGMARQGGWNGNPINNINNGMVAFQQSVVQAPQNNAGLVLNPQYSARHRMPAVQQTAPTPHSTWPQHTAHQAYVQNHAMQQSNRMQVPAYQVGHYRQQQQATHQQVTLQQQATLQHQYMHSNAQHLPQSLQHHHRMAGSIAVDNSSRQSILGSQLQGQSPVQQQRMRQLSASQQQSGQQSGSHHSSGPQQQQQVPHSQAHLHSHQLMQQQRHMPMSSPPINAQSQRHFPSQQQEVSRQPTIRRPSQEQVQQAPQPQPQPQHVVYACAKCGLEAHQKCSGCQTTFYCSRECQVILKKI